VIASPIATALTSTYRRYASLPAAQRFVYHAAPMSSEPEYFRVCSTCRKQIGFEQAYYVCSVTTCNRKRTGLFFCSLDCWNAHVPIVRHRDAWAEKVVAPTRSAYALQQQNSERDPNNESLQAAPQPKGASRTMVSDDPPLPVEALIVVSKLKAYVRARSGMNTSDSVVEVLSDHLRSLANEAIRNAGRDGRKTVMDRDFLPLLK
jgi:histone H3/H4